MVTNLRVETDNDIHYVAGGILPIRFVKPGQRWIGASGSLVTVESIITDNQTDAWVKYSWIQNDVQYFHEKLNFDFQCRYCLVVDDPVLPPGLG